MHNFFISIWIVLRRFASVLFRPNAIYFILVSGALAASLYYYVLCNQITSSEELIDIETAAGPAPDEINVTLNRNFSAAYTANLTSFVPQLDSAYAGAYNAIQIVSKSQNPLDTKSLNDLDHTLYGGFRAFANYEHRVEKYNAAYIIYQVFQAEEHMTKANVKLESGTFADKNYGEHHHMFNLDIEEHGDRENICLSEALLVKNHFNGLVFAATSDLRFNYFSPFDISQRYVKFQYIAPDVPTSLTFNFWGNTKFSNMLPEPDITKYNEITFSDSTKIALIKEKGLIFHVQFSDTANIQNTRMTILATLISVFFTLWLGILGEIIMKLVRRKK